MQFICVTFFYISVFYRYKKTLAYKTYDKNTYFSPSRTHTNERTPLCIPRTSPTYNTHFHPLQHHIKRGLLLFCIQNSRTQKILHTVKN